ncbi:hypothetical protein PHYPSEUDO_003127 [Phytophthora pseudosyringae]|uniref:RxLR effector protein n=1 Tax=Phytophthora pseudosyringae TaxID=221518 RepID=A0A8T1WFF4_9STRA|nr:hypothetical protein PHYPSEUDO_003127 [Phytophthora pseudosyringae]
MKQQHVKHFTALILGVLIGVSSSERARSSAETSTNFSKKAAVDSAWSSTSSSHDYLPDFPTPPMPATGPPTGVPETFRVVVIRQTDTPPTTPPPPAPIPTTTTPTGTMPSSRAAPTAPVKLVIPPSAAAPSPNGNSPATALPAPSRTENNILREASEEDDIDASASTGDKEKGSTSSKIASSGTSGGTFRDVVTGTSISVKSTDGSNTVDDGAGSLDESVLKGVVDSRTSTWGSFDDVHAESTKNNGSIEISSSGGEASSEIGSEGDAQSTGSEISSGRRAAASIAYLLPIVLVIAHAAQ